jgi:PPP family 3-phenylpropionic acid transporter
MAFSDRVLARVSPSRLVVVALVGAGARWSLLASVRSIPVLFALAPLHALSFGLWWVAALAFVKARAPAHALATAQGLFSASLAAGSVAGMLAWGALYRRAGGAAVFGAAAVVSFAGALLAVTWSARDRKTFAPPHVAR